MSGIEALYLHSIMTDVAEQTPSEPAESWSFAWRSASDHKATHTPPRELSETYLYISVSSD